MKITNITKNTILATKGAVADSFSNRMKGLLGRESLEEGEALVITSCRQIHMFFMRFAIDAIFLDKDNKIVGIVQDIKPFHCSPVFLHSNLVIELALGTIQSTNTQSGDIIKIEP
ncbi:MAG: DUF192 domain-containing protein [Candidatus Omnitrophota bacterium]